MDSMYIYPKTEAVERILRKSHHAKMRTAILLVAAAAIYAFMWYAA